MLASPPGTTDQAFYRREVRLAFVMNGGVSLAIWIGGFTYEVDCLRRASRYSEQHPGDRTTTLYRKLLQALQESVRVDVLAGASAGGINGALLAAATAWDVAMPNMRDTWVALGDIAAMTRSPGESDPPSVLRGDDYALPQIERVFTDLARGRRTRADSDHAVYLFLTTTGLKDGKRTFMDSTGRPFEEQDPRIVFRFEYVPQTERSSELMPPSELDQRRSEVGGFPSRVDFLADDAPMLLARAARATSSFPGAFEPHEIEVQQWGQTRRTPAIDGGVLDNQPFNPLLNQTALMPAEVPVRRVVGFIVPYVTDPAARVPEDPDEDSPEHLQGDGEGEGEPQQGKTRPPTEAPTLREVVMAASSLPRELPKLDSLNRVRQDYRAAIEADASRKRIGRAAGKDGLRLAADQLFETYRTTRNRAVLLMLHETRRKDFEPGTGPAGGDETSDPRSLPPIARVEDPLEGPDVPWIPPLIQWDLARDVLVGERWAFGIAPAERVASQALGFLRDLAVDEARKPAPGGDLWDALRRAREDAGALIRDVRILGKTLRQRLKDDRAVQKRGLTDEDLVEAARRVYAEVRTDLLLIRIQELSGLLDEVRRLAPDDADHPVVLPTIPQLLDLEIVLNSASATAGSYATPFEFLHMSAGIRNSLGHPAETPEEKLAGTELGHFAGFLKQSWRANDWLWGRLDGVEHLLRALVDVEYFACLDTAAFESMRDRLIELAFPGGEIDHALARAWEETVEAENVRDLEGRVDDPRARLKSAFDRAVEEARKDRLQPARAGADKYMRCVRSALAAPIELEIINEDLEPVAEAALADARAGANGSAAGIEWGRSMLAARPFSPDDLVDRFHRLPIGREDPTQEFDSRMGLGLLSRIVPVAVAGLAGKRGGLPAFVRGALATARGTSLVVGNMVHLAARSPVIGALLLIALIGIVAWGLAAPQTVLGGFVAIAALSSVVLAMVLITLFLNSFEARSRSAWRWVGLVFLIGLPAVAGLLLLLPFPDLPSWLDWLEPSADWADERIGETLATIAAVAAFGAALAAVGCAICQIEKLAAGRRPLLKAYRWLVFLAALVLAAGAVYQIVVPEHEDCGTGNATVCEARECTSPCDGTSSCQPSCEPAKPCESACESDDWEGTLFLVALLSTMIAATLLVELYADLANGIRRLRR